MNQAIKGVTLVLLVALLSGCPEDSGGKRGEQILNVIPVADAGPDQYKRGAGDVNIPGQYDFHLNGSASSDANQDPLSYSWTITERPDNSSAQLSGARSASPMLSPDAVGYYRIQLIVNDGYEDSEPDEVVLQWSAGPPPPLPLPSTAWCDAIGGMPETTGAVTEAKKATDDFLNSYASASLAGNYASRTLTARAAPGSVFPAGQTAGAWVSMTQWVNGGPPGRTVTDTVTINVYLMGALLASSIPQTRSDGDHFGPSYLSVTTTSAFDAVEVVSEGFTYGAASRVYIHEVCSDGGTQ